jgi:RNA polymerase sigma-70 factor (ECF subfamily)
MPSPSQPPPPGENTWRYLAALGRGFLRSALVGKVDLSVVIQQTLLEAREAGATFPAEDPVQRRAWLTTVFRNNLRDAARKATAKRRDVRREVSIDAPPAADQDPLADLLPADASTPGERAELEEEVVRMTSALLSLPENQRKAVELRYLQNFSIEAIATAMSKTKASVAGLLKHGLQRLRVLMKVSETDEAAEVGS